MTPLSCGDMDNRHSAPKEGGFGASNLKLHVTTCDKTDRPSLHTAPSTPEGSTPLQLNRKGQSGPMAPAPQAAGRNGPRLARLVRDLVDKTTPPLGGP